MIITTLSFLAGFATGFLVFRNNAAKAAQFEAKGIDILSALKGKK